MDLLVQLLFYVLNILAWSVHFW